MIETVERPIDEWRLSELTKRDSRGLKLWCISLSGTCIAIIILVVVIIITLKSVATFSANSSTSLGQSQSFSYVVVLNLKVIQLPSRKFSPIMEE